MMWHMGWGPWGWLWMPLSIALLLALTVAAILLVLRWTGQLGSREPDPEQLLATRFASGEIDADEYASRLRQLRATRGNARRPKTTTSSSQIPPG